MAIAHPGTLFVNCKTAKLFRDTEFFGKMDPYVKCIFGTEQKKTKTHQNAGKNPRWEETLKFKVNKESEIKFVIMDEDVTSDDHVGDAVYFLDDVFKKGTLNETIKLQYKGKIAGHLEVELQFFSDTVKSDLSG